MLAHCFMGARDLGIAEDLREALIFVLGRLERGELSHLHVDDHTEVTYSSEEIKPTGFNMNYWGNETYSCGTPACIGGWAQYYLHAPEDMVNSYDLGNAVTELFYPYQDIDLIDGYDDILIDGYDDITPAQAACALRNYLTTGQPSWTEVLGA